MEDLDIELRKLPPGIVFELARILECSEGWKQLMAIIPDSVDPLKPKYTVEHMKLVECASQKQKRPCAEILLEEWGTSGKKRPHLSTLRDLLVVAELYRAAEYVSVRLLKQDVPERPSSGPAAAVSIPAVCEATLMASPSAPPLPPSLMTPPSPLVPEQSRSHESNHSVQLRQTIPLVSQESRLYEFNYCELVRGTDDFSDKARIGGGAFGDVFLWLTDAEGCERQKLAVKRLHDNAPGGNPAQQFRTEIEALATIRHPNLLVLVGYSVGTPTLCLVYTYMPNGSLQDRLEDKSNVLSWQQRLDIARGTSEGIRYLHTFREKPLVHRDVKSANILLDHNMSPKVGDFGLVRAGSSGERSVAMTTTVVGTSAYMAPEAFRGDVSVKMDVFSFGVVLLELITGLPPYDENREGCDLASHVEEVEDIELLIDRRPNNNVMPWLPAKLYSLAEQCLLDKRNRPNMISVCQSLTLVHMS